MRLNPFWNRANLEQTERRKSLKTYVSIPFGTGQTSNVDGSDSPKRRSLNPFWNRANLERHRKISIRTGLSQSLLEQGKPRTTADRGDMGSAAVSIPFGTGQTSNSYAILTFADLTVSIPFGTGQTSNSKRESAETVMVSIPFGTGQTSNGAKMAGMNLSGSQSLLEQGKPRTVSARDMGAAWVSIPFGTGQTSNK